MNELDVIRDVAARLDRVGVPYMLTGSVAMGYYAAPRMTRDIDLVINVQPADEEHIAAAFDADYYIAPQAVREAVRNRSMFNVIHRESLIKVDLIPRKDESYRRVEFQRRCRVDLGGFEVFIVAKEDLILSKLYWARDSHSEIQFSDVRNLLATGYDENYVNRWLDELGLRSLAEPLLP